MFTLRFALLAGTLLLLRNYRVTKILLGHNSKTRPP